MENKLDTSIRYIKGVGETRKKLFEKLGIFTLRDLVGYFPRAYEDRTKFSKIQDLQINDMVCVRAMAATAAKLTHIRKGLDLVKLRVVDESGSLHITFFNQGFLKESFKQGENYVFFGKISGTPMRFEMINPIFEIDKTFLEEKNQEHKTSIPAQFNQTSELALSSNTGRIMPVYALTAKISQNIIRNAIKHTLVKCADVLPDVLPAEITREYELCKAGFAYENIHFPKDLNSVDLSRKRLIFEEFFTLAAAMKLMRKRYIEKEGRHLKIPNFDCFYNNLHFNPTSAQKRAIDEVAHDMAKNIPMNRLIQGDVGSGKTLVAAGASWSAWKSGVQTAFMVPTEILAKQHEKSLSNLLEPMGMKVGLLTGTLTAKQKKEMYQKLKLGEIDLVIGTHALISEGVNFFDLGLVITDEQHRFGVEQRSMLTEKGNSPHILVMSATPIPRTLALIIYGDLAVSIIDEMPPGRKHIETHVVTEHHRERVYKFIRKIVDEGRQVYIICPMVDEEDVSSEDFPDEIYFSKQIKIQGLQDDTSGNKIASNKLKSAKEYYGYLSSEVFPNLTVKLVHGKMKTKDKDEAMDAFACGEVEILVATTVVEVGVDVPNAALIIIENADRFGLSQLHQLRGRVGRGNHESFCILFNTGKTELSKERLHIMKATNDGFEIAEKDLKLRGPGDFFGFRQHGLPKLHIASFATDMDVLQQAQSAALKVLQQDPHLTAPGNRDLADQIRRMFDAKK